MSKLASAITTAAVKAANGAPNAEDILDKLLRAANDRADLLMQAAKQPGKFSASELQGLVRAMVEVIDLDNRWMHKLEPERLQQLLAERAAEQLEAEQEQAH